jgi:TPR repeat protein
MMWRGAMFSTLLHGSIVVAIVGGLPLLPNIFDRTEETESALGGGSSELPISIEIVSANSVDLQQNVIARRNRGAGQPAPPVASSKLQPQITGRPDATAQPNTASPAQNSARPSLPDAALDRPDTDRTARNRAAALPKKPAKQAQQQQAVNPVVQKNASQPIRPATKPAPPVRQASPERQAAAQAAPVKPSAAQGGGTAGGNEFIQAVKGRKRQLVVKSVESDPRPQQAITPRPESAKVPDQARQKTLARLKKAAAAGFPPAQYNLAGKFLRGEDTPKDMAAALKWLSRAAGQGYAPAQTLLGLMKFTGLGVKQDQAEAAFWWSLAAKAGDEGAKTAEAMIQNLLKPSELVQSKRLRARWGSLITDLADITAGDTNRRDLDGALRAASEKGDLDAVLSLLARGADPDKPGDEGRNAVINAAWRGRGRIIQLLLDRGVGTELPDDSGRTPLVWAAINGHEDIVARLVESGANPNQTDRNGSTALIRAAWNGHTDVVGHLIGAGADINARDDSGLTALAHARREGNNAIIKALRDAGAR